MYFQRPDCSIYYEEVPGIMQQETVFLHGNLASSRWWQPALDILKKKPQGTHRAIFIDWRGCGKSNSLPAGSAWCPKEAAQDCIDVIRHLAVKDAQIVGHSTGCLLAQYCLEELPETFSRAVLLDAVTPFGLTVDPAIIDAFGSMAENRQLATTVLAGTIRGIDPEDAFFQSLVNDCMAVSKCIWQGVPKAIADLTCPPDLAKINTPVAVLHGTEDPVLPIADAERLANTLPNGTFYPLVMAGHSLNVEDPQRFCSFLRI